MRENLRPFRVQLVGFAIGAILNTFWLVFGPDYMRYFAMFWIGYGLSFISLARSGD